MDNLNEILKIYGAENIGEYTNNIINKTNIIFKCKCGENGEKLLKTIKRNGAYCKKCTTKLQVEKCKNTCLEKYGETTNLKTKETKEKKLKTVQEKYGVDCVFKSNIIKEKIKDINQEKYGVDCVFKNKDVREKCIETQNKKYGGLYNFANQKFQENFKKTMIEKYGVDNPSKHIELYEKNKRSFKEKYGVEHPIQNQLFKNKMIKTNQEKYGVSNVSKNLRIRNKIQISTIQYMKTYWYKPYKFKTLTTKLGYKRQYQGYEKYALEELFEKYNEDDIITKRSEIPTFNYNKENKIHTYIPDIFIKSENKIIEVKSTWTYTLDTCKNKLKWNSVKENGYNFECWVYDKKKNKEIILLDQECEPDEKQYNEEL